MRVSEVEQRLDTIRSVKSDCETAHGLEDELWSDVLNAIVKGEYEDAPSLAFAALKTRTIEFERWYA